LVEIELGEARFEAVAPPSPEQMQQLARRLVKRAHRLLERAGVLGADLYPEDGLEVLKQAALQQRLPWGDAGDAPRALHGRVAVVEGFSLHADTWVHESDRESLERLARYGARGPLAASRVTGRDDGLVEYRMKRSTAAGASVLVLSPADFVERLAALVPPPGKHLVHFHGAFAPNARMRQAVLALDPRPTPPPPPAAPLAQPTLPLGPTTQPGSPRTTRRLHWAELLRRTFALEVFTCARRGGRRRVLALVTNRDTARELLLALRLPHLAPATGPPPRRRQLALPF
jgi:hypothetical protein